jgi:hypothetical protein
MIRKTFNLSPAVVEWLEKAALKENRSLSNYLDMLLSKIMKGKK